MSEIAISSPREPDPLREPWTDVTQQQEAASLGMWLFLMSEMLFFGGLFLAFSFSRVEHVSSFAAAAAHTNIAYGASNTAVLVTSSLTMTLAIRAAGASRVPLAARLLAATATLGVVFLVIKGFEYHEDLDERLLPGARFALAAPAAQIFFAFYWVMTGLHAIHLSVGVGLVTRLAVLVGRQRLSPASPQIETASLFWHLVDAFWVVLFPLLYVAGRA